MVAGGRGPKWLHWLQGNETYNAIPLVCLSPKCVSSSELALNGFSLIIRIMASILMKFITMIIAITIGILEIIVTLTVVVLIVQDSLREDLKKQQGSADPRDSWAICICLDGSTFRGVVENVEFRI